MTDINLDFIRENLEHGEIKKLAEENGIPKSTAYKIIEGQSKKYHRFIGICLARAIERATIKKSFNEKIQSL